MEFCPDPDKPRCVLPKVRDPFPMLGTVNVFCRQFLHDPYRCSDLSVKTGFIISGRDGWNPPFRIIIRSVPAHLDAVRVKDLPRKKIRTHGRAKVRLYVIVRTGRKRASVFQRRVEPEEHSMRFG